MQAIFHHVIALTVALIVAALPARAAEDPKDFVTAIYQSYVGKDAKGIPVNSPKARQVITPGLMKLIDADAKAAARRGQPPRLDSDPFIDAQDFDIKSFTVEVQDVGRARAVATVTFKNEAAANDGPMILALVKTGDAWRIDDFRGDSGSLRKYLSRKPNALTAAIPVETEPASADIDPMDAPNPSALPTFANRTPLRIGTVGLIARDLDMLTNYYRDLLGLTVTERTGKVARLGTGGVTLLEIEHRPDALPDDPSTAGLYHTAFLMPTRAGPCALDHAHRPQPRADHRRVRPRRERSVLSRRSRRQRHRGLQRPAGRTLDLGMTASSS